MTNFEQWNQEIARILDKGEKRLTEVLSNTKGTKTKSKIEEVIKTYENDKTGAVTCVVKSLEKGEDRRSITNDNLSDAFFNEKGGLYQFLRFVEENNENSDVTHRLVIGFRKNMIIIYYNNHKLWELSYAGSNKYKVRFNFNHARYYKKWLESYNKLSDSKRKFKQDATTKDRIQNSELKMLILSRNRSDKNKYSSHERYGDVNGGKIGYISCVREDYDYEFIKELYDDFIVMMDSYFNDSERDYFRDAVFREIGVSQEHKEKVTSNIKNPLIEKKWQQRLFNHFKFVESNGNDACVFAYDLEFSQKYPSAYIRELLGCNEPDILAIRFEGGKAKKLLLIEVKSTEDACKGSSGIRKHINGMKAYAQMPFYVQSRINDATDLLRLYNSTHLYNQLTDELIDTVCELNPSTDVEYVVLATNSKDKNVGDNSHSAIDYIQNNWVEIDEILRDNPDCKIWYTDSHYFDEVIEIDTDVHNLRQEVHKEIMLKKVQYKGIEIIHTKYGKGIIRKEKDGIISVKFESGEEKDLNYNHCLEKGIISIK